MSSSLPRVWPAPAKLNLFLHVLGRREDGYHEIQTLFQLIDLHDELQFEPSNHPAIARVGGDYGVDEKDDLVVKAAKLLQSETGCHTGVRIGVKKNIPLGAGLGGGSSDAATTLLALNAVWNCGLSLPELSDMGGKLGADVPVFIHGHSAMATGRGDKLEPVSLGDRHYVLVFNPLHISTAEVFSHPELPRNSHLITTEHALENNGRNDCEMVVCALYPGFDQILEDLKNTGPARMTGTGSCIFIPMSNKKAAMRAADEIKCRYNVRAVCGIDRSPVHAILEAFSANE